MKWSLNQAARETGVAKANILRAITRGRMSAAKNELGHYEIDPAEFYRVFPPRQSVPPPEPGPAPRADRPETGDATSWLEAELQRVSELLAVGRIERERERNQLEAEVRFLRSRVEHADAERDALTAERNTLTARLLTYQAPPPAPPPAVPPSPGANPGGAPSGAGAAASAGPAASGRRGLFRRFRSAG